MIKLLMTTAFACGYFITCIFRSVNAVQAPYLTASLHLSNASLGSLTSCYLLGFALAQLPLGILLDRFGIRIIQTLLFILAGIGTFIFAKGGSATTLAFARFIIGIGVSGGLMAAFKANTIWFPKKLPFMNGLIMAVGALGALTATKPTQIFIHYFGWRQFNIYLAIATLLIALFIFLCVPKGNGASKIMPLKQHIKDLGSIYRDRFFWRITPIIITTLGFFMATQGLWTGGWLMHVNHMSISDASSCLASIAIAMAINALLIGAIGTIAMNHGRSLTKIVVICISIAIAMQVLILFRIDYNHYLSWFLLAFFIRITPLTYSMISNHFPLEHSGKSITAINILTFLSGFAVQFLIGWIIHFWEILFPGSSLILGYQIAFGVFLIVQIMALVWFVL